MNTLLFRGRTQAEDLAIRSWLHKQGVTLDPRAASVDPAALEKAGIDVAKLKAASLEHGIRDGFDLAALDRATVAPSRTLVDRQARELSELAKKNLLGSVETAIGKLEAERDRIARGDIPSRAELGQLAARLGSVNQQLFEITHGNGAQLAHWDAATFDRVRVDVQAFLAEVARFGEAAGELVASGDAKLEDAERLQKGVADCERAIHVVARDVGTFVDKKELLAKDLASVRDHALLETEALGHDAAWFDAHFEVTVRPDPHRENEDAAVFVTRAPIDLDWSNRGIESLIGGFGAWAEHEGSLNLSGNQVAGPWGLPAHTTGDLDLSKNAFEDLRAFDLRPITVDGNVDLSHNANLRDLTLIHHVEAGGDLILVGVPAKRFDYAYAEKPKVGGDVVLHPSQVELIEDCKHYGIRHRVVEDPTYAPFVMPKDPEAWLLALTWDRYPGEHDLHAVLKEAGFFGAKDVAKAFGEKLLPRCHDADPNVARAAIALLARIDRDGAKALAARYFDAVPEDPRAPLGAEIAKVSSPLLGLVFRELYSEERFGDREAKKEALKSGRYPLWGQPIPKSERLALELVRRAEAGEPVTLRALRGMLGEQVERGRDGDSILPEATVAVVAAQLREVTEEKGQLRLHLKSGEALTLEEAFGPMKVYASTWDAFERTLRRQPEHAALTKVYEVLKTPGLSDVIYAGAERRTESFRAELAVRRAPSPAVSSALRDASAMTSRASAADVTRALDRIVARFPKLAPTERVTVLQELVTAEVHELRHHPDLEARLAWATSAAKLVPSLPEGQGELITQVIERFREHLANAPDAAAAHGLDRALVDLLHGIPSGGSRGYFVALHAPALDKTELGRSILTQFFEETITRAGDAKRSSAARHEDFKAVERVAGCLFPVITKARAAEVAAKLKELPVEGDLAYDRDKVVAQLER